MASEDFDIIAKKRFEFLEKDYSFILHQCDKQDWGYELIYKNETTGVRITYEFREAYVFIVLYKLINGKIVENPNSIEDDTKLNCYGLDDILTLRNPSSIVKPAYEYGDDSEFYNKEVGLDLYVTKFAENLRKHSHEILLGNFDFFVELDNVVKERVRKYKN